MTNHVPDSVSPLKTTSVLAAAAIVATVVMWASAFVITRWAAPDISPGPLALVRLLAGTVTLTLLLLWVRRGQLLRPSRQALKLTATYGVMWFALYTVVFNWAGHFIDAGTISMLVNLAPLMVAIGAGLFFGEGFPRRLFIGMGISLLGIGLITVAGSVGQLAFVGLLIAAFAATLYAGGMLIQKQALRHTDPLTATWLACLAGTVALVPFAFQAVEEISQVPTGTIVWIVYMGIGPSALGFWFWGYAMMRFPAGKVAASSLTVPAVVVVMSALVLQELPPLLAAIGGAICLIGVGIAQWKSPKKRTSAPEPTRQLAKT